MMSLRLKFNYCIFHWSNELSVRNWSGRQGFNHWSIHTKDSKMVLDTALLNIQHYKMRIKRKVAQSREWSSVLLFTSV